jgi:hypothetical protein
MVKSSLICFYLADLLPALKGEALRFFVSMDN